MLESLHITNIAVIKSTDINFSPGFTVLTGETGAGKSIIIDSINLIMGAKPSRDLIRSGEDNALVSAVFSDISKENLDALAELGVEPDDDGCIYIQRTISSDGKAKTKLNGRTIPVSLQRDAVSVLINIHGQHENQMLLDPAKHIVYLDSYADDDAEIKAYREAYNVLGELKKSRAELERDEREKLRMMDMLNFQIKEIDAAKLKPGEEEELEAKRKKLKNLQILEKNVNTVYNYLYHSDKSACDKLNNAIKALTQVSDIIPNGDDYLEKLEGFRYEIEDIAESVYSVLNDTDGDPEAALDRTESRLDVIAKLKRKYGSTVEEVIECRNKAAAELDDIESSEERAADLDKKIAGQSIVMNTLAGELTQKRREAAQKLGEGICDILAYLDMEKVRFSVDVRDCEPGPNGKDSVEFMISTNPGEPLKSLSRIASGGELSRVMLAIKSVLADRDNTETLIFDEIDTGISGKTSHKIGVKLRQSARSGQVFCVTHSPQIAALAENHLFISKSEVNGRTETSVRELTREERVNEIARIMGSDNISDTLLMTAREMIEYGENQFR